MDTDYVVLTPDQTLADAAREVLAGRGEHYPVVESGTVVGLVTESALRTGLRQRGPQASVREIMDRDFVTARVSDSIDAVVLRMMGSGRATLVLRDRMLAGLVTPLRLARILELGVVRSG
jgi:predicted transcriptional regulator